MFHFTTNWSVAHFFRKFSLEKASRTPVVPDFSQWLLKLLMSPSLEVGLSQLLSDRSIQFYLGSRIRHFQQACLVINHQIYQAEELGLMTDLDALIQESAVPHKTALSFKENTKQVGLFSEALKHSDGSIIGSFVVITSTSSKQDLDIQQVLKPLLSVIEKGLEASLYHQQKLESTLKAEKHAQAADLHDTVAQVLGYVNFKTATLNRLCQNAPDYRAIRQTTDDIHQQVAYANRLTRELINSSRIELCSNQLSAAIVSTVDEYEQLSTIVFEVDNRCKASLDGLNHANDILFIVRESLSNLVRHSHATHARILVTQIGENIHLRIEDNGIGIENTKKRNDSHGMRIMKERARKIQGDFTATEREGGGTCVCLVLKTGSVQ